MSREPCAVVCPTVAAAAVAALCALVVAGCASAPPPGPPAAAVVPPQDDVPPEVRDLRLTVYPTPRQAEYGTFLLPLDGHRLVDVGSDDFLDVLEELELTEAWRELPPEGYVLHVGWHEARTLVVLAGADEDGRRWAEDALEQLTLRRPGQAPLVRDCLIFDAPGFPLRGSKRPQAWEEPYRANFAWGARDDDGFARRIVVPFHAPGSPLDATASGVEEALAVFGPWQARGVQRFAVKFDDVGFAMTPRTQLAFGAYARALVVYLGTIHRALRSVDPDARLYYLPQTYWWNDARLAPFASAVRTSGGLPPDVGMVFTGPEIISETIDAAGLDAACSAFGATVSPALLYDNLGREGDWGPLLGRDPALVEVADAVFGERGTPVHRLTRLDWLWNPTGYDAERSWRRAILELAGPRAFPALRDACAAFRGGATRDVISAAIDAFESAADDHTGPLPRSELVRLLREDLRRVPEPSGAP